MAPLPETPGALDRLAAGWEFATTPLHGLSSSRLATMHDRNRERVARLEDIFNDEPPARPFFRTFEIECETSLPLGWSLTTSDRAKLDEAIRSAAMQEKVAELSAFLRGQ